VGGKGATVDVPEQTEGPRVAREKPLLQVVVASTRPGRVGLPVARWFAARAADEGRFVVDVADLAEIALPFLDEPNHPRLRQYVHDHTRRWSERVDAADAFAFVVPEYNHGFNAPLKNAIDFLYQEWQHKPVGLVSYGGVSGGTRAAQQIKQVLVAVKAVPLPEAVILPFVRQHLEGDELRPPESVERAADAMLGELARWADALRPLRIAPHA
jgi:NAD(P)H-dependent FMN reductase